jgi:hypothetical protein
MEKELQKLADDIAQMAIDAVANEWKAQGHNLTGSAIKNMETVIRMETDKIIIEGFVPDYMAINNKGVLATKIPYYPGSGRKESEYIKGLMKYAKQRFGASDKEAKSIAFAIASKHKKEGMPTIKSQKHSKTGKRTGFIEQALEKKEAEMADLINRAIYQSIIITVETFYKSILNR